MGHDGVRAIMDRREHWDRIYGSKQDQDLSWFEAQPAESLQMLEAAGVTADSCVIDVGGGNSRLVDALLARGLRCLAVLDVSAVALDAARARVGQAGGGVTWIAADVCGEWSLPPVDIWHDRAVFHFLTEPDERAGYVRRLQDTVKPGGNVIIATFAMDGPEKCSGLPIVRYSPDTLAAALGDHCTLQGSQACRHVTPWGATQSFQYSRFRRSD